MATDKQALRQVTILTSDLCHCVQELLLTAQRQCQQNGHRHPWLGCQLLEDSGILDLVEESLPSHIPKQKVQVFIIVNVALSLVDSQFGKGAQPARPQCLPTVYN